MSTRGIINMLFLTVPRPCSCSYSGSSRSSSKENHSRTHTLQHNSYHEWVYQSGSGCALLRATPALLTSSIIIIRGAVDAFLLGKDDANGAGVQSTGQKNGRDFTATGAKLLRQNLKQSEQHIFLARICKLLENYKLSIKIDVQ